MAVVVVIGVSGQVVCRRRESFILAIGSVLLALLIGASSMARAQAGGDVRAVLGKHGLLGIWSYNCGQRPTYTNRYSVYRPLDERRVQRDEMVSPTQRIGVGVVESAVDVGPHDVEITATRKSDKGVEYRDVLTLHFESNRRRTMEHSENGKKQIAAGRYLKTRENGTLGGKPVDWVYKCE